MDQNLLVISCPVDSLACTVTREEAISRVKAYLCIPETSDWESTMKPYVYRVIVAPYPLTLSIASVLFPLSFEIYVDTALVVPDATLVSDPDQWLQGDLQKKNPGATQYNGGLPPGTYAFVLIPDALLDSFVQAIPHVFGTPLSWPQIIPPVIPCAETPLPTSTSPIQSQRYLDEDDLAARVLVRITSDLDELIANKRKSIEALEPAALQSVSQSIKTLNAQLVEKKLPTLQLPEFRMEENKETVRIISECVSTSKKIQEEVAKLQERSKKW